jgi:hypothetical protein
MVIFLALGSPCLSLVIIVPPFKSIDPSRPYKTWLSSGVSVMDIHRFPATATEPEPWAERLVLRVAMWRKTNLASSIKYLSRRNIATVRYRA